MDNPAQNLLLLLLFALAVLFSAYFASAETAFTSVSRIKLRLKADAGNKKAVRALKIEEDYDKALTTILIGNNAMHIGASAIATLLASRIWGNTAVTAVTFLVTLILFLFGETIPKRYAITHPLRLSLAYSLGIHGLMKLLSPLVAFFGAISKLVSRLIRAKEQPTVDEDELMEIIDDYAEDSSEQDHGNIVRSAFRFSTAEIETLYTPLAEVESIDADTSREDAVQIIRNSQFTRLPVWTGTPDNIIGVLNTKIFLKNYIRNTDTSIRNLMADIPGISRTAFADDAVELMKSTHKQMLAVKDADEKIIGILTSDDVLEKLVGQIIDDSLSAEKEESNA